MLKNIFTMSLTMADADWSLSGFLPWSCGHWCFCIEGDMVLVCVHAEDLPGDGYTAKLTALSSMKQEGLSGCMDKKHNFMLRMKPGDLVCIPSSFIAFQQAVAPVVFVRWAYLDGSSQAELRTVLSCCHSVVKAFPSVAKDGFANWMAFLQERAT